MTGVSMEVKVDDKQVLAAFKRLETLMRDTTPIMHAVGVGITGNIQNRLSSGRSANKWAPLNPAYAATKRNKNTLVESGGLRDSIHPEAGRDYVSIGTNKIYAAIHQFGGTIKPKSKSHLAFRMAGGYVFAKSVTIPARPFLTIEDEDEKLVAETIFQALQNRI